MCISQAAQLLADKLLGLQFHLGEYLEGIRELAGSLCIGSQRLPQSVASIRKEVGLLDGET